MENRNYTSSAELREDLIRRNDGRMLSGLDPEDVLVRFAKWWYNEYLSSEEQMVYAKLNPSQWAGMDMAQRVPDDELLLLWAIYLM